MKKIIISSIALLAAGALPAAAQTVNWNGSFGGASGAGSAVTGGFAFGAGSTAAGQAATTGWAEGKGTVVGIGGGIGSKMGHYGGSGGIGSGYFTSGSGGQSAAMAQSGTGFLGGSSAGSAFGTTSGGSSGSINLRR